LRRRGLRADLPGAARGGLLRLGVGGGVRLLARPGDDRPREPALHARVRIRFPPGPLNAEGRRSSVMPRRVLVLLGALALFPLAAARQPAAPAALELGFAEVDITPKVDPKGKPVFLAGFGQNRKATGVHDPLLARAVVLRSGKDKVALVSVDLVGL